MIHKDIFRGLGLAAAIGLGLTGCESHYDVYPLLVGKCQIGETLDINGVPVARTTVRLKNGDGITAGSNTWSSNVIKNLGNGAFSVSPETLSYPPENLPDGRIVLLIPSVGPGVRIAFTESREGDVEVYDFTLNCKDQTVNPPVEK